MAEYTRELQNVVEQIIGIKPDADPDQEILAGLYLIANPEGVDLQHVSDRTKLKAARLRLRQLQTPFV